MGDPLKFNHEKFLEMFGRRCECGSKEFRLALEDIDMVPLALPADQRVTCIKCGRWSIQTVSAETDSKPKEGA